MELTEQINRLVSDGKEAVASFQLPENLWRSPDEFQAAKEEFLQATQEIERLQWGFWNLFNASLQTYPSLDHERSDSGLLMKGSEWRCFFHGVECDFRNVNDDRSLRVELLLGFPGVCSWGALELFLKTTRPPWRNFPLLRDLLCSGISHGLPRFVSMIREVVQDGSITFLSGLWYIRNETLADALGEAKRK